MTSPEEQPFLAAILSRYREDAPRLVYADFLAEIGELDRAELIRVQLALARLLPDHPRRPALADRQLELINRNETRWSEHIRHLGGRVGFRRGLPEVVSLPAEAFIAHGEELFRDGLVRRVRLLEPGRVMSRLAHSPTLARIHELDLSHTGIGNGGINVLVRSPYLTGLTELDIGFNGLDDAGIRILARASSLPGVRSLAFNDNNEITGEGLRGLAESPYWAGLRGLDVSGNDINDTGVKGLTAAGAVPRLQTLRLADNHIGDAGVLALVKSRLLDRLLKRNVRLDLRANAIGAPGAEALAGALGVEAVRDLDFSGNYLGDRGAAALALSPHLVSLRSLRLARNQITDAGATALANSLHRFPGLRQLDLSMNRLTRRGLRAIKGAAGHHLNMDTTGNVHPPIDAGEAEEDLTDLRRRVNHPTE